MHSVYVSSFWGLCSQTPTGDLPLDAAGGLPPPDPLFCPLSKFLATALVSVGMFSDKKTGPHIKN